MSLSRKIAQRLGKRLPESVEAWLDRVSDKELWRINLKKLSQDFSTPFRALLADFLLGVHKGAFVLNWEYHCPHCNGIPDFKHRFGDVAEESYCGLCQVGFRNTLDVNVEVTFSIHEGLKKLDPSAFETLKQEMIASIKAKSLRLPDSYASGLDLLTHPVYQELFGGEVLGTEESLSIRSLTFLFTDIKGSTQMYSDHGDAASYRLVREHFKILFQEIEANEGVVVKTIGDAVMATFIRPVDAVKAALSSYRRFQERSWDLIQTLEVKMGMHAGSAIAVTMNDRVDYFGNTVNMAARIQGVADNHSVSLSSYVAEDAEVRAFLKSFPRKQTEGIIRRKVALKGIEGQIEMFSFTEKPRLEEMS